jgi:DNA-directed RNA polymerase specialized sigma24 family protein
MFEAVGAMPALDLTFRSGYRLSKPMGRIDVLPAEGSDSDSFRALVEEHSPMVFRLAYRMTGNVSDAEDVVQETFLKAHRSLGGFDERARFGTWIYRIAVNAAIDLIRRRGLAGEHHRAPHRCLFGGAEAGVKSEAAAGSRSALVDPDPAGPSVELRVLGDRTQRVGGIRAFYDCLFPEG